MQQTRRDMVRALVKFTNLRDAPDFKDETWVEAWGLDSLALFRFVLFVEDTFGFSISEDEFSPSQLHDFSSFVALVNERRRAAPFGRESTDAD